MVTYSLSARTPETIGLASDIAAGHCSLINRPERNLGRGYTFFICYNLCL